MDCPRCSRSLPLESSECPDCGYCLEAALAALGSGMVNLPRLVDSAHCLRLREFRQIDGLLDDFQHAFPQLFFAVYLGVLPSHINIGELSFWLLNRAAFDVPDQRLNEYAILLVIDPVAKTAGLTVGYALERVLDVERLTKLLRILRTPLWHGEYAEAIQQCIAALDKRLRKVGRRYPRNQDTLPPQNCEEFLEDPGWSWLRKQSLEDLGPRAPLLDPEDERENPSER